MPPAPQTEPIDPAGAEGQHCLPLLQTLRQFVLFRIEERENAPHALRHLRDGEDQSGQSGAEQRQEPAQAGTRDKHDSQRGQSDESGGSEVDLYDNERHDRPGDGERQGETAPELGCFLFVTLIPPSEEKEDGHFAEFARLEAGEA